MKRNITLLAVLLCCLGMFWDGIEAASFKDGSVTLQGRTVKGADVKASVRISQYSSALPYAPSLIWWGARETKTPRTIVAGLDIQIGAEQVPVPASAITDLGNPRDVSLRQGGGDIEIVIKGGDAATSYEAVLSFKDGYLRKRRVILSEFPSESWEETTYSYNTSNR
jgi:hypothetical protein